MTLLKLRNSLVIFRDILKRERYTEEVLISIIGSMKIDRDISRYIVNRVQQTLSVLNEFYNRLVQSSLWKRVVRTHGWMKTLIPCYAWHEKRSRVSLEKYITSS